MGAVALATKLLVNFSAEGCLESKVLAATGHSLVELSPVLQQMSRLVMVAPTNRTLLTAFRKFSSEKFLCVARSPLLASHFVTSSANHRKDTTHYIVSYLDVCALHAPETLSL